MRLHRFYIRPEDAELGSSIWLQDERLRHQWLKVLRYQTGGQVVLFDGVRTERLYKITEIASDAVHLEMVTEFERKLPPRHIYLFFSLLKKDKNEWVLQKCTELGVSNFVPILAARSEKTGFNPERAGKIVIEAAEQCGRGDIPEVRQPITLATALKEYKDKVQLLVCEERQETRVKSQESRAERADGSELLSQGSKNPAGIFIGPEGGWTDEEAELFDQAGAGRLHLGSLTLRAETAAVAASSRLLS